MTRVVRRALVAIVGVLVFGVVASACSGGPVAGAPGSAGTSGRSEPAFVDVQVTPALAIIVQNRAAQPFLNVSIVIKPATGATLYTTSLSRLEPGEVRNLSLGNFRSPDGKSLSTIFAFVRPKEITVTAVDRDGGKHEITVPWTT